MTIKKQSLLYPFIRIERDSDESAAAADLLAEEKNYYLHLQKLHARTPEDYVAAPATLDGFDAAYLGAVRAERDRLLAECDWTQTADCPLSDAQMAEWAAYRQNLRDLPNNYNAVENIVWPVAP